MEMEIPSTLVVNIWIMVFWKREITKIEEKRGRIYCIEKKRKRRNFQFNLTLIFTSFQGLRRARMKLNSRVRSRVLNFQLAVGKDSRRKRIIRCFAFRARLPWECCKIPHSSIKIFLRRSKISRVDPCFAIWRKSRPRFILRIRHDRNNCSYIAIKII